MPDDAGCGFVEGPELPAIGVSTSDHGAGCVVWIESLDDCRDRSLGRLVVVMTNVRDVLDPTAHQRQARRQN